jgi:hypothetical protein
MAPQIDVQERAGTAFALFPAGSCAATISCCRKESMQPSRLPIGFAKYRHTLILSLERRAKPGRRKIVKSGDCCIAGAEGPAVL